MQVYLSARSWQNPDWAHDSTAFGPRSNILRRGVPVLLGADGSVEFEGGERADRVDVVMHATGYRYTFPFLQGAGVVAVNDNRQSLRPLYFSCKLQWHCVARKLLASHQLHRLPTVWGTKPLTCICRMSRTHDDCKVYRPPHDTPSAAKTCSLYYFAQLIMPVQWLILT